MDSTGRGESVRDVVASEHAALVRLCARITGDRDAAEDLAQEAIYEALAHADTLRDPSSRAQWLRGIARNVCLRSGQRRARESARLSPTRVSNNGQPGVEEWTPDGFDVEMELERSELAHLLDRAMALLPPDTRAVLVGRYVEESPLAEIAARLDISEGAVAVRLHRGKRALRDVLATEMREEAASYDLAVVEDHRWRETRIWCPRCAGRRLLGLFTESGALWLRCPDCYPATGCMYNRGGSAALFEGVRSYKPAFSRLMAWIDAYFGAALVAGGGSCAICGCPARVGMRDAGDAPPDLPPQPGAYVRCEACSCVSDVSLEGLALCLPETRRFWREHPRMLTLPGREIEVAGGPAVVTSFQDASGRARLDVVSDRATLRVLGVYGDPERRT